MNGTTAHHNGGSAGQVDARGDLRRATTRLVVVFVVTGLLTPLLWRLSFDARPSSALPTHSEMARHFAELSELVTGREVLIMLLQAPDSDEGAAATTELTAALNQETWVSAVLSRVDRNDLQALLSESLALWPARREADLDQLFSPEHLRTRAEQIRANASLFAGQRLIERDLIDPLGLLPGLFKDVMSSAPLVDPLTGFFRAGEPSTYAIFVRPNFPSTSHDQLIDLAERLSQLTKTVTEHHPGLTVAMTGSYIYAEEYQRRLSRGLLFSALLSLSLIVLICWLLYRDLSAMGLIAGALALAGVWTMIVAELAFSQLQVLAVSAASILPAVGIDAGVHFYAELRDRLSVGDRDFGGHARAAIQAIRKPVLVAGVASSLGFLSFCAADVRTFVQLGVLLAVGVVANMVAMLVVLPDAFTVLQAVRWYHLAPTNRGFVERLAHRLAALSPLARLLLLGVVVLGFALGFRGVEQRFGFATLADTSFAAVRGQRRLEATLVKGIHAVTVLCRGDTDDQMVAHERELAAELRPLAQARGGRVEAPDELWVTAPDRVLAKARADRVRPQQTAMELERALDEVGFNVEPFHEGLDLVRGMAQPGAMKAPAVASFFHEMSSGTLRGQHVGLVSLYLPSTEGVADLYDEVATLLSRFPLGRYGQTSIMLIDAELRRLLDHDFWLLSGLAALGVVVTVIVARMALRPALVALSAIALTLSLLWLAMGALHLPLNLVTLLVFPLVLGIGIDASIYMCEHHEFMSDREGLMVGHLRPLLGSTLTTLVGFLGLLVVPYEPVRQLGMAVSVGLALALLVALIWVPMFSPRKA